MKAYMPLLAASALCLSLWGVAISAQQSYPLQGKLNLPMIASKVSSLMQTNHYNPKELEGGDYQAIEKSFKGLAAKSKSSDEFIGAFNELWSSGPFSHVRMVKTDKNAEQTAVYLDNMKVGGRGAQLTWQDSIAVLTVRTMMGVDTIEQIDTAYDEIIEGKAKGLIIDLRENNGGAFAVRPLVSHLLQQPLDVGVFLSNKWTLSYPPPQKQIESEAPWEGWSIRSFWHDVQKVPFTRVQFQPTTSYYPGPVYVLVSNISASAAELAVDAMSHLPLVTTVGATTAGEMLSQKMFDLSEGLQIFLPIADFYSSRVGRIEGKGVNPNIKMNPNNALEYAVAELSRI